MVTVRLHSGLHGPGIASFESAAVQGSWRIGIVSYTAGKRAKPNGGSTSGRHHPCQSDSDALINVQMEPCACFRDRDFCIETGERLALDYSCIHELTFVQSSWEVCFHRHPIQAAVGNALESLCEYRLDSCVVRPNKVNVLTGKGQDSITSG